MGKLGQLLVARGWITVQQLTRAIQNQNVVGGRLGTCLIEMDAISEENLLKGLSEQLGVPPVELDDLRMIPEEVRALVPDKLARRCRTIPFQVLGGRLDVAMMDPRNLSAQDEIAFASGKRLKVHVAHEARICEALEKYFDEELPSRFGLLLDRLNRARYLWGQGKEAPAKAARTPAQQDIEEDRRFTAPRLVAPPPLLDLDLPPPVRARATPAPPVPPAPAAPPAAAAAAPSPAASAPEPEPAPPATPRRPTSVTLTPDELAALQGGAKRRAAPAPASQASPASPATLAEIEEAFKAAGDTEEIAHVLLEFLSRTYRHAALFQVMRDRVTAWMSYGDDIDQEAFGRYSVGFDQPSLFLNLRQGSGVYLGPLPPMPAHRELAGAWGGELPRDCVMLPVRVKDRLVTVVYADGATKGLSGVDLPQLQRLTASTAAAFERCILHKKRGGEGKG